MAVRAKHDAAIRVEQQPYFGRGQRRLGVLPTNVGTVSYFQTLSYVDVTTNVGVFSSMNIFQ